MSDEPDYNHVGPLFIDGFTHYTQYGEKWHEAYGDGQIILNGGAWGTGCVNWPGQYTAQENATFMQLTLQHLKRRSIQVSFNFKADNFSGAHFLRFYDNTQQYICGFGFTPMGHPFITTGSGDNTTTEAYTQAVQVEPGKYHTLKVGVGLVNTDLGYYMTFDLDGNPITGFGLSKTQLDIETVKIRHLRVGPMGDNTFISDLVVTASNFWINQVNNIVTGTADVEFAIGVAAGNCEASVTHMRYDQCCYANIACGTLQGAIQTGGDFLRLASYSNIESYGNSYIVNDGNRAALLPAFGSGQYDISNMYHADNFWAFLWSPSAIMDPTRYFGEQPWPTPGEV